MLKISAFYYFKIENGKRKLDYKMAVKIASIFNLTPDDIFYKFLSLILFIIFYSLLFLPSLELLLTYLIQLILVMF